jgi:thymidylate kinase
MELSGVDFLEKVSKGYKEIALHNSDRCKVIDCNNKDIMTIHEQIVEILNLFYGKNII